MKKKNIFIIVFLGILFITGIALLVSKPELRGSRWYNSSRFVKRTYSVVRVQLMSEVERNKHCESYSGEFGVGWGNQAHVHACEDAGCEVETVFEEKKSLSMDEMLVEIGSTHSGTQEIICK